MKTLLRNLFRTFFAVLLLTGVSGFSAKAGAGKIGTTFPVVDTGQTKCYGSGRNINLRSCPKPGREYFGQDGNYTINAPSYKDNGDGTVTDNVTGLMWQKGFTRNVAWSDARSRSIDADTGGYKDWRVPTIKELYSLMNFMGATGTMRNMSDVPSDAVPYTNTRYFDFEYPSSSGSLSRQGKSVRFIDAQYITSTAYKGVTMGGNATFFGVNFADGRIKGYPQKGRGGGNTYYLRLVRGNPDYGRNAFSDNRDGTVSDAASGLQWMQADSGDAAYRDALGGNNYRDGRMDWPEALEFCEKLNFAEADDWRLPNAKELQGILDYSRSPQATRSAAIDPILNVSAITDEAGKPNFPGYWSSTTHLDGRRPGTAAVVVYFGEALGTGSMGDMGGGPQGQGGEQGMGRPGMQGPGGDQGQQGGAQMPSQLGRQGPSGRPGMMRPGGRPGMPGPGFGPQGGRPGQFGTQGPGGQRPGRQGQDGRSQQSATSIIDVHGAGAQRSDPKIGDPSQFPKSGQGPQGDVRRVFNYVRCVRNAR